MTQLTDKSTGVSIDKLSGRVTTANSALNAGTRATFRVTNTSVVATDLVHAWKVGGAGTNNAYSIEVTDVRGGSFDVTIENITGGSLSEAIIIGFCVFKTAVS